MMFEDSMFSFQEICLLCWFFLDLDCMVFLHGAIGGD